MIVFAQIGMIAGSLGVFTIANCGHYDLFIIKLDSAGIVKWTRQIGTEKEEIVAGIATTSDGHIYVAGTTFGSLNRSTKVGVDRDFFVIKLDANNGTKVWTRQIGTTDDEYGQGIASDSSGNIYVRGATHLSGPFVMKFDSNGTVLWTRQMVTNGINNSAGGIAVDGSGSVYVTGSTKLGLDGNTLVGGNDIYVLKYDTDGNNPQVLLLGSKVNDYATGISTDTNGNIYVTGWTLGNFDDITTADVNGDLFVFSFSTTGTFRWKKQLGSVGSDISMSIATDLNGSIYVTGETYGGLDGNTKIGAGSDLFIVKYNTEGVKQ